MRFIDFFAGIGGFRRGMELAGHECVGFCEWDKFATASYISMHLITEGQRQDLAELDLKKRQEEILKEDYRNGEWYSNDIRRIYADDLPAADCWCAGFPCQDISVAGKQLGFRGKRSSLFFTIAGLIRDLEKENRPSYLFLENVKNLLSVNRGFDFAKLFIELDAIGYDAEWQVLNTKDFGIPQNRERVFIVGHLRGRCTREVFPVTGTASENTCRQVIGGSQGMRVYDNQGLSCTLKGESGGMGGKTGLYFVQVQPEFCDYPDERTGVAVPVMTPDRIEKRQNGRRFKENGDEMFTLTASDRHGVVVADKPHVIGGIGEKNFGTQFHQGNRIYDAEAIAPALTSQPVGGAGGNTPLFAICDDDMTSCGEEGVQRTIVCGNITPSGNGLSGRVYDSRGVAPTLTTNRGEGIKIKTNTRKGYAIAEKGDAINLAFPESKTRRGRIGKGFAQTLDCSCNQGTLEGQRIRRLTPKECFRLQGWTDDYYEKAKFVNSDNQLYRQAGNGVTVAVIKAIAAKMEIMD